jgi:hypothetical protein
LAGAPPAETVSKLGVGWARVLASPELPEFRERLGLPSKLALPFETFSARPSPTIESSCGGLPPALPAGWRGMINRARVTGSSLRGTARHFIGHPGLSSPSSCARQTESWRDRIMQRERPGGQSSMILFGNDSVASGCGFAVLCTLWLANSCLWDQGLGKGWLPAFPRFPPLSGFRAGRLLESPLAKRLNEECR